MKWHVPSEEEITFASEIMSQIVGPELEAIKSITPDNQMDRCIINNIQFIILKLL